MTELRLYINKEYMNTLDRDELLLKGLFYVSKPKDKNDRPVMVSRYDREVRMELDTDYLTARYFVAWVNREQFRYGEKQYTIGGSGNDILRREIRRLRKQIVELGGDWREPEEIKADTPSLLSY